MGTQALMSGPRYSTFIWMASKYNIRSCPAQILANSTLCSNLDAHVTVFMDYYIKQKDTVSNCRADKESVMSAFKDKMDKMGVKVVMLT